MIKIGIVDDNLTSMKMIEEKLSDYEEIIIAKRASNGNEILDILSKNDDLDLLFMDIEMPIMNGIIATEKIKERHPSIKIVMITIFDEDEYIFNAIKAGADSYILKEMKAEKIHECIIDTLNGGSVMSPSIALKTLSILKNSTHKISKSIDKDIILTEREIEILEQISKGYTNKLIAENLFISTFTVKRHIENIYKKLQAHNRIELMEIARKKGIL